MVHKLSCGCFLNSTFYAMSWWLFNLTLDVLQWTYSPPAECCLTLTTPTILHLRALLDCCKCTLTVVYSSFQVCCMHHSSSLESLILKRNYGNDCHAWLQFCLLLISKSCSKHSLLQCWYRNLGNCHCHKLFALTKGYQN